MGVKKYYNGFDNAMEYSDYRRYRQFSKSTIELETYACGRENLGGTSFIIDSNNDRFFLRPKAFDSDSDIEEIYYRYWNDKMDMEWDDEEMWEETNIY